MYLSSLACLMDIIFSALYEVSFIFFFIFLSSTSSIAILFFNLMASCYT
jgi:hypothetical protein